MNYAAPENQYYFAQVALMLKSYRSLLGINLIESNGTAEALARDIFHAPFVLISHNTWDDPVFNYANFKALELFEFTWEEFIRLPSRLSAEPIHQSERARLLAEVNRKGYIENYQGIRIAKSGRRFAIKNATVWNLTDPQGQYSGQAAFFENWQYINIV